MPMLLSVAWNLLDFQVGDLVLVFLLALLVAFVFAVHSLGWPQIARVSEHSIVIDTRLGQRDLARRDIASVKLRTGAELTGIGKLLHGLFRDPQVPFAEVSLRRFLRVAFPFSAGTRRFGLPIPGRHILLYLDDVPGFIAAASKTTNV